MPIREIKNRLCSKNIPFLQSEIRVELIAKVNQQGGPKVYELEDVYKRQIHEFSWVVFLQKLKNHKIVSVAKRQNTAVGLASSIPLSDKALSVFCTCGSRFKHSTIR